MPSSPATRPAAIRRWGRWASRWFHAHVQLKAAITQRLGPEHAACFARPDRDPRDDTVRWVADVPGPARRWTELAPDEQARLALAMEAMRAEFRGYIAELRAAPPNPGALGTTPQAFAAMLEQALHIPGPEHLHVVGEQPVFSFWGFHQADARGIEGLSLQPAPAAAAATAMPPPVAVAPVPWWRRWWWLLALLLLLLLLALALLGPWGCAEKIGLVPPGPTQDKPVDPKPGEPPATGVVPVVPGTVGPGVIVPGGPGATGPGATGNVTPSDPSKPEPPKMEPPKPEPPTTEPPKPEPPKPPESPEPPKPPEPPPQQQQPPPPPKPMEIPPDAAGRGDVGFLDGQWKSRKGLVDQQDGKPLEQFYRFDEKGKGETVVRRADGVECKAPAEARFDGGKLTVEEKGSPTCPDGRSYGSSRTECERTATGATVCRGVNPDGSGYRVGLDKVQP